MTKATYIGNGRMLTKANNGWWYSFSPDDLSVGLHMLLDNEHEPWYDKLWSHILRKDDIVAIVGSNIGYHDVVVASLLDSSTVVHSFEPNPLVLPYLRYNTWINGFGNRIIVHPIALDNEARTTKFYQIRNDWGGSGLYVPECNKYKIENVVDVGCAPLDRVLTKDYRIDVIKIDAEGSEARILEGMEDRFRRRRIRLALVEHNFDYFSSSFEKIVEAIRGYGYTLLRLAETGAMIREDTPLEFIQNCDLVLLRQD